MNKEFQQYLPKVLKANRLSYFFSSTDSVISTLFQSVMFVFGGVQIIRNEMSIGEFLMINSYFSLMLKAVKYFSRYTYFWGNDYREYVSPTMIRQCLYSYYKDFFVLKEHGEIIGVIAVKPAHEAYLNDAVIQLVSVPKNFFSSCIKEILLYYNNFPYKKINALRIQIAKKSSSEEIEIADALEANGFVLESIREKEYCGNQDIYVYSTHITRNN